MESVEHGQPTTVLFISACVCIDVQYTFFFCMFWKTLQRNLVLLGAVS